MFSTFSEIICVYTNVSEEAFYTPSMYTGHVVSGVNMKQGVVCLVVENATEEEQKW